MYSRFQSRLSGPAVTARDNRCGKRSMPKVETRLCRSLAALAVAAMVAILSPAANAADPPSAFYSTNDPAVLTARVGGWLSIAAIPDKGLYDASAPPTITIRVGDVSATSLSYRVNDGFGNAISKASKAVSAKSSVAVPLPSGHGYYEVVATLFRGTTRVAEVRRSIGVLPPAPPATGKEPWGMWIQGDNFYPQLGVRWTREGIHVGSYTSYGKAYFDDRIALFQKYRNRGIRIVAYPKELPAAYKLSREVLADTPEAWAALEQWWTLMVRTMGPHVDAWGVVNEPIVGMWKGNNDLIVRYWKLMRKIVDQHDPGKPLIGPSLGQNQAVWRDQYQDLLNRGFGKLIDVIEMHSYIADPQKGWAVNTQRIIDMTKAATGRTLPVWSTEHGSTADYPGELAQAQHLVRSAAEAKKMGTPVFIWHMFSHPQGTDKREVNFSLFRNSTNNAAPPQPRPAGVAFGTMTRQLAGAKFLGEMKLGTYVRGYAFSRAGQNMAIIWSTSGTQTATVPANGTISIVDMFGKIKRVTATGSLRVSAYPNPRYIWPLSSTLPL
jgi:hypothetical protein